MDRLSIYYKMLIKLTLSYWSLTFKIELVITLHWWNHMRVLFPRNCVNLILFEKDSQWEIRVLEKKEKRLSGFSGERKLSRQDLILWAPFYRSSACSSSCVLRDQQSETLEEAFPSHIEILHPLCYIYTHRPSRTYVRMIGNCKIMRPPPCLLASPRRDYWRAHLGSHLGSI